MRVPSGQGHYPATLLTTSDHDDRVVPLHTLKHIATMQHVLGGVVGAPPYASAQPREKKYLPDFLRLNSQET